MSRTTLVDPFDFDWEFDDSNQISLKENELYFMFKSNTQAEFIYAIRVRKIGFFIDNPTRDPQVYVRYETDSREGEINIYDREGITYVSVTETGADDDTHYINASLTITKPIFDFFLKKVQEESEGLPKRQAAQIAWNSRKHVLAGREEFFGRGKGAGAGSTLRGGRRKTRRSTRRRVHGR